MHDISLIELSKLEAMEDTTTATSLPEENTDTEDHDEASTNLEEDKETSVTGKDAKDKIRIMSNLNFAITQANIHVTRART